MFISLSIQYVLILICSLCMCFIYTGDSLSLHSIYLKLVIGIHTPFHLCGTQHLFINFQLIFTYMKELNDVSKIRSWIDDA
jgi:hypothetical protein